MDGANKKTYTHAKVVWFNDDKGFGFAEDSSGNLIFVDYSAVSSDFRVRKSLLKDQEVEVQFVEELGELRATKVRDAAGNA